jgi:uncharacterized protein
MSEAKLPTRALPVQAGERIEFVDILRGFAILGILAANMAAYSGMSRDPQVYAEPIDRVIVLAMRFLVEAKFYSLFSFLFGWGMAVQMVRTRAQGVRFVPLYTRRLLVLLGFGLLHAVFIWSGDILTTYALLGFLLLLFRRRSGPFLLVAAGLALAFSVVLTLPGGAMDAFRAWYENTTSFLRSGTIPDSVYASSTYGEITRLRIQDFLRANSWFVYWSGNVFGMFLLGLYAGKRRIFQDLDRHLLLIRAILWVGLGIGLVFNAVYVLTLVKPSVVPPEFYQMASRGSRTIGAPALMLFYVSTIVLLVHKKTWYRRLSALAPLGRGALSNYLLQSVVCTLLFYGYGLGLYGQVDPLLGLILTIVVLLTQIRLSSWWFSQHQFGPLEWLWRSLIYGRVEPLQRKATRGGRGEILRGRLHHLMASLDPKAILAGVWIVLLVWVAVLAVWHSRLEGDTLQLSPAALQEQARATPTAIAESVVSPRDDSTEQVQAGQTVVATPAVQPVTYEPGPIAASGDLLSLAYTFSAEAAMAQIETLTGPPYLGRYPSSPEGWATGDYIAEQFARYGLQPAGEDGTFFQPFPFEYVALKKEPSLVVEEADGTVHDHYVLYRDYSAIVRWYSGSGSADAQVVWGNRCTGGDFALVEVPGRIVICRVASIIEAERNALEHGASGLLVLTDPAQRPADFGSTYFEPWVPEPIPVLRVFPSVAEDLLLGSGRSLPDLSLSLAPFSLQTRARLDVQTEGAEVCPARACTARNVLGVLPGRDPKYADQIIVLGAHYDHLGQGPEGTVWAGANDNASGVAVLLEMARAWQEQGYIPRHTVLFAAWDAEEEGLLGSSHYVREPRYPLESTVAMIQLDMVGAGGDTLWIDGGGELAEQLQSAAQAVGVETESTSLGRSDHVPFLQSGIPADLLIWQFHDGEPRYHRPEDTPATIEVDKLEAVGRIVGITLLGLTEGEPAIADLLERRAEAVEKDDLAAFLATSLPNQEAADRYWFNEAQALSPSGVTMEATNVRIQGRIATATVHARFDVPAGGQGRGASTKSASLAARFEHDGSRWLWGGPDLTWIADGTGFAVAVPPEAAESNELADLGRRAAEEYARLARLLGLPNSSQASLLLFPNSESLSASTSPGLQPDRETWVGPGTVKLTYTSEITADRKLSGVLANLLLAEAGVSEDSAPWLWHGLPLAAQAQGDPAAWHAEVLSQLHAALAAGEVPQTMVTSWAAVDYLRDRVGWQGIGVFIARLGQVCQGGLCSSNEGVDEALAKSLHMDSAGFAGAWQTHWRERLATAQADLDKVLAERTAALLAGDEAAFLNTVDQEVPNLLVEQQHWFADAVRHPFDILSLTGSPLALMEDGSILANVTLEYALGDSATSTTTVSSGGEHEQVSLTVLFAAQKGGHNWAGVPFRSIHGDRVRVLYPEGQEDLARDLLDEARSLYAGLSAELGLDNAEDLTIKLYESDNAFRSSISPMPSTQRVPAWSRSGESVKLRISPEIMLDELRPTLVAQVARALMQQMGVDAEWLLKGVGIHLSRSFDGGALQQATARNLPKLSRSVPKYTLYDLRAMPGDEDVSGQERGMLNAQAWDTVRYLVYTHGWDALLDLLQGQGRGLSLDAALENAIGQSLPAFEAAWRESLPWAHARSEWIETANAFDPEGANEHVQYLASPELAGRQAGSPGAETAAAYIAAQFKKAGLVPVGDVRNGNAWESGDTVPGFYQTVPFTRTVLLSAPRLEFVGASDQTHAALAYRQDFLLPVEALGQGGTARGELVWIGEGGDEDMDLAGKIVIRRAGRELESEVRRAAEHGAGGLIIVGGRESSKELLAKAPFPPERSADHSVPVVELTKAGFARLMELMGTADSSELDSVRVLPLGVEAQIEIPISAPEPTETANLLGLLPGADPVLGQEVIILGAHYDHIGDDPDGLVCSGEGTGTGSQVADTSCVREKGRRYPGANDNASGVGVLLEIARLWHETGYRPQRSILFAAWGAQEQGEVGSRYYVEHPMLPMENIVAMVQLDTVGGGGGYYLEAQSEGEPEGLLLFNLMAAEDLVDGRLALSNKWGQSDQVPFHDAGVPALLLTWREASDDNWPVDIADEVEPYRLGVTGRMVTLALMSLAR